MGCCRDFSRGILVFTNAFFLMLGAVLVALGGYMTTTPRLDAFTEGGLSSFVGACGGLIVFIALLGYCGAHCESRAFLCCYSVIVIISILAQIGLAGFMYELHDSLNRISNEGYEPSLMSNTDYELYHFIKKRFHHAYHKCDPTIVFSYENIQHQSLNFQCSNPKYEWFMELGQEFCHISLTDLKQGSEFLKCSHGNFHPGDLSEQAVFCSCQSRLLVWLNEQGTMIGIIALGVGVFEFCLVMLSCFVMCTRRRRHGYHELRMPVKQQYHYSNQPHGVYYQSDQVHGQYGRPMQYPQTQSYGTNQMINQPSMTSQQSPSSSQNTFPTLRQTSVGYGSVDQGQAVLPSAPLDSSKIPYAQPINDSSTKPI